jgi:hypothetical protein
MVVGSSFTKSLQNTPNFLFLCETSKHELGSSKHEPCKAQNNPHEL